MLFSRRVSPTTMQRIWGLVWPRRGWWRVLEYLMRRLQRLPDTPHGIAAGFAAGAALSLTPFLGLHIFMALGLAWLTRGNLVAAAVGTILGNPWTFPFILPGTYALGVWMLGSEAQSFSFDDFGLSTLLDDVGKLLVPMSVGSIGPALVAWVLTYTLIYRLVSGMRQTRAARIEARKSRNS